MKRSALLLVAAFTLLATCSTTDPVEVILSLIAQAGQSQTAAAGEAVATRPAVRLTQTGGDPVAGRSVTFEVTGGGGSATGTSQTTDANGVATVGGWTLGTTAGPNTLIARATGDGINGNPVTFTATGNPGPAAQLDKQAGDGQTAIAGQAVTAAPSVRVRDMHNNPVSGAAVTFAVTGGGGTVAGAQQTTGANGVATAGGWTLGTTAGANTLTATAAGSGITGNPASFTATGVAGPAAIITKTAGDGQTAAASTALPVKPQVTVTDANNNPVSGAEVVFAIAGGGGAVNGATQTTNAAGVATVGGWTLGPGAGENRLTATVSGSTIAATFTATGTTLVPAKVALFDGDMQVIPAGQPVPTGPAVRVTAANDSPVPGVTVDFAVTAGGGVAAVSQALRATGASMAPRASSARNVAVVTDANGVARLASWTLGSAVGANTLQATVQAAGIQGNPVTFNATAAHDPAAYAGNWSGNWNNTTFSTTGTVTASLTVDPQTRTGSLVLDFNGTVLGGADPAPETYNGSYSESGVMFSTTSPTWGALSITVTPLGQISGTGMNPAPGISRVDFQGTATPAGFSVTYTVTFTGGGTAVGTWAMTK